MISARTKEVLRARRASGLPVGRPKGPGKSKLDKHRPEIEALLANGSTQKFIAKRKLTEEARNQETEAVKSYGEFGTFEPLGPLLQLAASQSLHNALRSCRQFRGGLEEVFIPGKL